MTQYDLMALGVWGLFLVIFIALSWYFSRRVMDMRFAGDKSLTGVIIYWLVAGLIIFFTIILLVINNLS